MPNIYLKNEYILISTDIFKLRPLRSKCWTTNQCSSS